jgi:hypothetical protein
MSAKLDWRPIATAPKDGTWFLTYSAGSDDYCYPNFDFAKWDEDGWAKWGCGFDQATHWAPVPAPPA